MKQKKWKNFAKKQDSQIKLIFTKRKCITWIKSVVKKMHK